MPDTKDYSDYVEHPRYGRGPRITSLVPKGDTYFGWRSAGRIDGTAVEADTAEQCSALYQFTHYFDIDRKCEDCSRRFIFFADEQKHWYEQLKFGFDSDCVRCVPCRKKRQGITRSRERYNELFHFKDRLPEEDVEMVELSLLLFESGTFTKKSLQLVRRLLNRLAVGGCEHDAIRIRDRFVELERDLPNCR